MNRLWSRVGVRTASVGLLAVGVAGGFYLGPDRSAPQQGTPAAAAAAAQTAVLTDADEMQLLKDRQNEHAAARAARTQVESAAARRAAGEAKAAASKARQLEKAVVVKKAAEKKKAEEEKAKASSADGGTPAKAYTGDIPASCNEYSGNRKIGCALMLDAGFGLSQMGCLDKLWTKESHWNTSAHNGSSGAHGIPQAVPGSKMAAFGSDWRTGAATQIKWGLSYIKGRYSTPCGAWAKSQSSGWY